jgi:hypothetical protein
MLRWLGVGLIERRFSTGRDAAREKKTAEECGWAQIFGESGAAVFHISVHLR